MQLLFCDRDRQQRLEASRLGAPGNPLFPQREALGWLDQYWPMLPSGMAYFAVGDQTAEVLRASGCQVATPSTEFTSEGLLALPELQHLEDRRALIFCGVGGRQTLADELARRGARVDRCPLYRRNIDAAKVSLARRQLSSTDCLVVHSGELLQSLAVPPPSIAASVPMAQSHRTNCSRGTIHKSTHSSSFTLFNIVTLLVLGRHIHFRTTIHFGRIVNRHYQLGQRLKNEQI